ncbi:FGGY family carbohydrate kinase [Oceanobacillus oncorhynchi subsp. oncorhynchi]|uniref:xylulokinase n=1 Tax=Oceanobacillus oncorhynchi TaxID=545501 RepID=UPI0031E029DC
MTYVAVFDIGTTAVKGILVDKDVQLMEEHSVELTTFVSEEGLIEQQPADWWKAVIQITSLWWKNGISPESVRAITFSGQMEDVISISEADAYRAILYSDMRAGKEAEWITKQCPEIRSYTGNNVSASTPLAKIKWLEKYSPDQYENTMKFVFSSKDYVIYKLTNEAVTDPITAATTGMMDLKNRVWNEAIYQTCRIDEEKLPALLEADSIIGAITEEASKVTGFSTSTIVINGTGDAGATTLGAGAVHENDCYFYMGTTGWLAIVERNKGQLDSLSESHFNLAFVEKSHRISVAPLLNVGNVHQWAAQLYIDQHVAHKYETFETLIEQTEPGSGGVLFLPYLNGERNPMIDPNAKGAYWGITPHTERKYLARAALEGVTFSLKQTLEMYDLKDQRTITLIGGVSKSNNWCQMMTDIMNHPIRVPLNSEYLPSIGVASTAFIELGWCESYRQFVNTFVRNIPSKDYTPNQERVAVYAAQYETFKKLHPALQSVYR